MAHNLWWTWNEDAKSLYSGLNPELWEEAEQNPVLFLERMDYEELEALTHDGNFMRKMENVYSTFKAYLDVEPDHSRPSVAYFSMEYGLDRVLINPEKPDVPINKNDAFQKVQKRRVQEKR